MSTNYYWIWRPEPIEIENPIGDKMTAFAIDEDAPLIHVCQYAHAYADNHPVGKPAVP